MTKDDGKNGRVVAIFDSMVNAYDTIPFLQICAKRLVERADLSSDAHVLDIATGTGWVALFAAPHVGTNGKVLGVDLANELMARAQQKATSAGLSQVEFQKGDAQQLEFDDQSFDVVLCASALFFMSDMLATLREWRRVLKPGGQVVFTGFGATFRQPMMRLWNARLEKYGISPPESRPALRLAEPETCQHLLQEAGFAKIEVQSEQLGYHYSTTELWWEEVSSTVNYLPVLNLSPTQREQFKAEHLAEVEPLLTEQGIWVDVPINFAHGWKPQL